MVLHTLNCSADSGAAFNNCLRFISAPAALLLIEDGVYAATQAQVQLFEKLDPQIDCFVLKADVEARGLGQLLDPRFTPISDQQFVELSLRCHKVQSWY